MKDVFEWLEDVRTSTMSEAYQMNKDTVEDDVKTMNSRLEKVGKLEEFKMIEQSIAAKSTMAFCTVIGDKMVIANSSGVLVFNDNETKTGIEQAMKETDPEKVIRYRIYDDYTHRIRKRKSKIDMLQKSLYVVPWDFSKCDQIVDKLIADIRKDIEEIKKRSEDDKYKASMLARHQSRLDRANQLKLKPVSKA